MKLWRWVYFSVFVLFCGLFYQWFFGNTPELESAVSAESGFVSVVGQDAAADDVDYLDDEFTAELIAQMQLGDALDRRDLLESALDRLLVISPNHPGAFFFRAYIALADDDLAGANAILAARELAAPGALETRQLSAYIASMSSKRVNLAQARILRRTARYKDALSSYKKLFPDGMPTLKLELELLDVLANIEGNEARVLARLSELNRQYPNVALLELSLAEFRSQQNPYDSAALASYRSLAQGDGLGRRAAGSWIRTLGRLPKTAAVMNDYALLAQRYPDDLDIQNAYRNVLNELLAEKERLKNPYYRAKKQGLASLDADRLAAAEKKLNFALRGFPDDADVNGGLGVIYLRRGDHDRALRYFKKAARFNQDPDLNEKWAILISTSRYWSALRRGEALMDIGKYEESEAQLNLARKIDSSNAATYVALAELALARGKPLTADVYYGEALRRDSGDQSALWGRVQLRERLSGRAAALAMADREYSSSQRQRIATQLRSLRIDGEMDALSRLNPAGNKRAYINAVDRVIALQPTSPWQRADIANALLDAGETARADALMADWADGDENPEMAFSYGLYLSARGNLAGAIRVLNGIPEGQRSAAMQGNIMRLNLDRELAGMQNSGSEESIAIGRQLDQMAKQYSNQPLALLRLADIAVDLDERERALRIVNGISADEGWEFQTLLDYARLLLTLDQFDRFMQWQKDSETKQYSLAEQAQLDDLVLEYYLARARFYTERGDTITAYSMYQRALQRPAAGQVSARISLLKITAQLDRQTELKAQSEALLAESNNLSSSEILDISTVLQNAKLLAERHQFMAVLKTRDDLSAQQFREAMLLEKDMRDWDSAEEYAYLGLQQAQIEARPGLAGRASGQRELYADADEEYWLTSSLKSSISEFRERRDSYIKFGIDQNFRSGRDTTSQVPIEVRWAVPSLDGHLLLRVDYVTINSNTVDYIDPGALPPTTITRIPFAEKASGIALGIGWDAKNWHADIGTTPIGFRESNFVFGAGLKGSVGELGWNVVLSQRPEVSSTLSYAGMEVPSGAASSGTDWGGVILTGAKLGLSYDLGGSNGYWASLQYHLISGDKVADNTRLGLLGGVYHRVIDEENRKFRVGLNVLHFQYDKNLSEVSLQHGSYFSPQNYISVSLPIRYYGRYGNDWSYLMAASVSNSWSSEDAPYLLGGGSSSGGGFGYALEAAIEKRVSKRWYVGLAADIQRADFFEPNHVVMYAKYTFNERWQPIWTPPEPPIPYSRFD